MANPAGRPARPVLDRFYSSVDTSGDCWTYRLKLTKHGYARWKVDGKSVWVHRWAYEHFCGPIPDGLVLDHLCRVRHCARPQHLEPVTCAENIRRGETGKHQSARTHCPYGHSYAEFGGTWRNQRYCRECKRLQMKARRDRATGNDGVAGLGNVR